MKKKFTSVAIIVIVLILVLEIYAKSQVVVFVKKNYLDGNSSNIKLKVKSEFQLSGPFYIFHVEYKRNENEIEVLEVKSNMLGKVKSSSKIKRLSDDGFKEIIGEIKLKEISATCEKSLKKEGWYELIYRVKMDMPKEYIHYLDSGDTRFDRLHYYISFSPVKDNNYMFGEMYPSFQLIDYGGWTYKHDRDTNEFVTEAKIEWNFIHEDNKDLFIKKVEDSIIQIVYDEKVIKKIEYKAK